MSNNEPITTSTDSGAGLAAIAAKIEGSVVAVRPSPPADGDGRRSGRGRRGRRGGRGRGRPASGIVVADGLVLTSAHNARTSLVEITFSDGRVETGRVRAADHDQDLAVIAVDTGDSSALAPSEDESSPIIGDVVVAASAPTGVLRVTEGKVAATGSRLRTATGSPVGGVFEHTAPMPPGASGGPVLDTEGRLVGINTNRIGGGLYQAIPADHSLSETIESLAAGTVPRRRRLGIVVADPRQAAKMRAAVGLSPRPGVLIAEVLEDGPAAAAELAEGELILAVDDHPVASPDDLLLALAGTGEQISVTVAKADADARTVTVDMTHEGSEAS